MTETKKTPKPATVHKAVVHRVKKVKEKAVKYFGTGRRKEAIARVCLTPGSGKITVNGHEFGAYFCGRKVLEYRVQR